MILDERFEILGELGRGGSGTVFRAKDRATGRVLALKVFSVGDDEAVRVSWRREAELLARLRHPGIVKVLGSGSDGREAWIATELIPGGSLQDRLAQGEPLPPEQAVALVAQAARTLGFAHEQGVVHQDIKPANLLLAEDGSPRITDFGVARVVRLKTQTERDADRGYFLGTPAFVAPELFRGGPVDGRADVYSLGVVLYRCLSGQLPFPAASSRELVHRALHDEPVPLSRWSPWVPRDLETICMKAMARRPENRFPEAVALARALEEAVIPPGLGARSSLPGTSTPPRKGVGGYWKILFWCLLSLVLGGLVFWLSGRAG